MMPSTQQKQARPVVVAQQWMPAGSPGVAQQAADISGAAPAVRTGGLDVQEVAELKERRQTMEGALRDVMTTGQGATASSGFLQARGHNEVVGMIGSEGVPLSATQ